MTRKILPLILIFICATTAWMILGATVMVRSDSSDQTMYKRVGRLWGQEQSQTAPSLHGSWVPAVGEEPGYFESTPVELEASAIKVDLNLEHRRKGLLWYATYRVKFDGEYTITNPSDSLAEVVLYYYFPDRDGIYDDFVFLVDNDSIGQFNSDGNGMNVHLELPPGESKTVRIAYGSQGLKDWWYRFGQGVSRTKRFNLEMTTNFDGIDFPEQGISPVTKEKTANGWKLGWKYDSLISGVNIGITMPTKLNPGPFVGRLIFFAPVSLFFFFFLIFIITMIKRINLHPMNYFFLATGFFAFHLLLSYLVDHIDVHLAMFISSAVSIGLVLSYMRLVIGWKFAMLEVGVSQLVYLILFSYAFFLEGYTGLTITICSILTLFVVMQATGRMNWEELFKATESDKKPPAPPRII